MQDKYFSQHWLDLNGNPAGGTSSGKGVCISWQNGPLAVSGERLEPNGAFVETVLSMVVDRINFYENSKFSSTFNREAIYHIQQALSFLDARTKDREKRGVEGTHKE